MIIDDKIRDEKLQNNINREALLSRRIDKYEYLTGEKILPYDQSRITEQAKFTYSSLKNLWKNKQKQLRIKEENK